MIPTLNAASYIKKLIESLRSQTEQPYEIIVVDSTSDDNTVAIAREMGVIVLTVSRKSFDHGGTRNYAASHATGDIFVFITQDALPSDNVFLENLIKPFESSDIAAAYGRQVAVSGTPILERIAKEVNYPLESMIKSLANVKRFGIKTFFFTNVCSAIRSKTFREIGGFPAPIMSNEDMILAAKCILAGYSIAYAAEARVDHSHDYTLKEVFGRYFDIGGSLRLNKWILTYATAEGEGTRLMKTQMHQLMKPKMWRWIPRWIAESAVKYLGYRLGLMFHVIPPKLRPKCSMHPFFWEHREITKSM
nr:glycosyltransferase family 2 protein [Cohnella luojiensis]